MTNKILVEFWIEETESGIFFLQPSLGLVDIEPLPSEFYAMFETREAAENTLQELESEIQKKNPHVTMSFHYSRGIVTYQPENAPLLIYELDVQFWVGQIFKPKGKEPFCVSVDYFDELQTLPKEIFTSIKKLLKKEFTEKVEATNALKELEKTILEYKGRITLKMSFNYDV